MLKRLFTPGNTQVFDKEIPAGATNDWVPFEGSNYGLQMEQGTYAVTIVTDGNVQLQANLAVHQFKGNSYNWVSFTEGVTLRLRWESKGELRFRVSSEKGGYVTVLVTPVTNSLSLSLVNALTSCVRRWRHGAKTRWFPRPGGVHTHHERGQCMGIVGGPKSPLVRKFGVQACSPPRSVSCRISRRVRTPHQRVGIAGDGCARGGHGRGQDLRRQLKNRSFLHHTPRLATVGGGH